MVENRAHARAHGQRPARRRGSSTDGNRPCRSDFCRTLDVREGLRESAAVRCGEQSRKIVSSLDDIVWSIDARNDTLGDLTDRMQDYINNVLPDREVRYEIRGPGYGRNPRRARQGEPLPHIQGGGQQRGQALRRRSCDGAPREQGQRLLRPGG
ncbi:MAG: hypothetical protein U5K31_12655 [Balneolaceae bacterium]|nr:hypothetical protein [Balneolaceae bacterium]